MFDAVTVLPDLYLQPTVPGFEYPRRQAVASLRFIGALPLPPLDATPPEWADELDGSRRVVLVTQGTLANHDLGQLIGPTLEALADRPDLLVLVTTGGRPLDAIPTRLPDNARVAAFLPYDWLMPKLDVVVTNGGYGTVNHALSLGLPLVVAGVTEDKAEVAARVAWSGSGINLATNNPTAAALRQAIDAVLDEERYRLGARSLSREFAGYDAETEVLRLLEAAARPAAAASLAA
jgi:UDP:flavonoid glycosyltransferase YjiC (YdhE family)